MTCNIRILVAALALSVALVPRPGASQVTPPRVGIYFDQQGTVCSAPLEPFDPVGVQAHVLAFVEPGTEMAGAFFRLELPPQITIVPNSEEWPKNSNPVGSMTSVNGMDLQFQLCTIAGSEPVRLVSFVLNDISLGGVRPDLEIRVLGGTIAAADTLVLKEPNLKVCDPNEPEGYLDLIVAPSTLTTLNCSSGDCPCETTAVRPTTWTAVRKLYADD
jgi:hypothetical protein